MVRRSQALDPELYILHRISLDACNDTRFSSLPLLAPSLLPTAFSQFSRFSGLLVQEKSCNPRALSRSIWRSESTAWFFRPFHPCQNYDSMEQSTPILEKRQTTDNLELPPGTSRELFPPVSFHHKSLTVGIIEWTELDFTSAALRCSMYAESTEIHPECAHEKTGIRRVPKFDAGELAKERKEVTADISPQLEALFLSRTSDARRNHFFAGRRDSRYEYA